MLDQMTGEQGYEEKIFLKILSLLNFSLNNTSLGWRQWGIAGAKMYETGCCGEKIKQKRRHGGEMAHVLATIFTYM